MGTPSPGWNSLGLEARQARVTARRRRPRRLPRWRLSLLALATTAVLVVIGLFIMRISKIHTARPAALSVRTVSHAPAKAHHSRPPTAVKDARGSGTSSRL